MRATIRRYGAGMVLLTGSLMVLAGCGSSSNSGTATTPAPGASSTATGVTTVAVSEKEFSITLPQTTFTPGTYTFQVTNQGTVPHNLTIQGPGVNNQASPTLQPGQSGSVTVTLQTGSYEFWCSVDSHKDKGMDLMVTVAM
jgi:uncharacterized cupredoxin-like copper-binding protein